MSRRRLLVVAFALLGVPLLSGSEAAAQGAASPPAADDAHGAVPAPDAAAPWQPTTQAGDAPDATASPGQEAIPVEGRPDEAKTPALAGDSAATSGVDPVVPETARAPAPEHDSLVEDDVRPTITIFEHDDIEVRMGGLLQIYAAPWVGSDSLITNDDFANREGFELHRARLGVESWLGDDLRFLLVVNPLESDPDVGTISDASVTYVHAPWLRVALGTDKVPFTRAELQSSRELLGIERPLAVRTIVPDRRLGITVDGDVLDGQLAYLGAFMNGTEGYELGNQYGGFLYAARLQYTPLGLPRSGRGEPVRVSIGAGALYEDGPATNTLAASADVVVAVAGAVVTIEAIWDRLSPDDSPIISPGVADTIERRGAYLELGYTLPRWSLQPVVRAEIFDDATAVDDAGDVVLVSAGVNALPRRYTRVQLHYLHRAERHGSARKNDAVIANVQAEF